MSRSHINTDVFSVELRDNFGNFAPRQLWKICHAPILDDVKDIIDIQNEQKRSQNSTLWYPANDIDYSTCEAHWGEVYSVAVVVCPPSPPTTCEAHWVGDIGMLL